MARRSPAILYRPAAKFTGPRPVMVKIHGGPDAARAERAGRDAATTSSTSWASRSSIPTCAGRAGSAGSSCRLDDGKLRGDAVKDIGALLDWIATRPELDKNRVVLIGVSYGGWLALQAGITYNDRIRGIIAGRGHHRLRHLSRETDPARQENRRREYGDERDPRDA